MELADLRRQVVYLQVFARFSYMCLVPSRYSRSIILLFKSECLAIMFLEAIHESIRENTGISILELVLEVYYTFILILIDCDTLVLMFASHIRTMLPPVLCSTLWHMLVLNMYK